MYMVASRSRTLYTGVTGDLTGRVIQHKQGLIEGFTRKYRAHRLVYFEVYRNVRNAIAREKQIKRWRREKKVALIEKHNPAWDDLAEKWYESEEQVPRLRPAPSRKGPGSARDDNAKGGVLR